MAELVIPGTYIEVRAEGLISAGRVATGIVGVVGTAVRGEVGRPVTLSGFAQARELFGLPDNFNRPENGANPLTLVRALEYIFNNGASTVVAVRVASASSSAASYSVRNSSNQSVAVLTAKTPGSWGNNIRVIVEAAEDDCRIDRETHDETFNSLNYASVVPSPENQIRVIDGTTRVARTAELVYRRVIADENVAFVATAPNYQLGSTPIVQVASVNQITIEPAAGGNPIVLDADNIIYNSGTAPAADEVNVNTTTGELTFGTMPDPADTVTATYAADHSAPTTGQILITTWDGSLEYPAGEEPDNTNGDVLLASYLVAQSDCVQVVLEYEATSEVYITPDGNFLSDAVNAASALVVATADETNGDGVPAVDVQGFMGTGSNTPGSDGADATVNDYELGLEALENQLINIVVLAGQDSGTLGASLQAHLNRTEQVDLERIGVIGAPGSTLPEYLGHTVASGRMIVVAPGLRLPDGTNLPTGYTAAAVAGLISSLSVQSSLTNKTVTIAGLDQNFNRSEQGQLIRHSILGIIPKNGFRVLKGVTTEGEGQPFSAIPTRRIVDYAKYGVRSASNPYIGRLNNSRVRSALQSTLEAFLTRMVEDEALTGFELQVTATRAQEIAGEVSVIMTIQPTFSIDYIRVVMNLQ